MYLSSSGYFIIEVLSSGSAAFLLTLPIKEIKDFDCKCGNLIKVPSPEVVCQLAQELGMRAQITVKHNCDKCGRPYHTHYDTHPNGDSFEGLK